jgi:hypothetical protein
MLSVVAGAAAAGFDRDTVMRAERMLNIAAYKRRQAAPGVKVTLKNFGRDRRQWSQLSFKIYQVLTTFS